MTDADRGTDGRKPDRPPAGLVRAGLILVRAGLGLVCAGLFSGGLVRAGLVRDCFQDRRRSRALALVLMVTGGAVATAACATAISRALAPPMILSAQPSAPNDPQAGDFLLLPKTTDVTIPGAEPLRSPIAAPEKNAAAAIAIHIPRLNVRRELVRLRVQSDRSLTVPKNSEDVGWWSGGPHPGGPGAALFAGHVNRRSGPAVFYNLRNMRVGDLITVDRSNKTSAVFKVVGRASYPRKTFPDEVVYRTAGKPSIHLVTCDGRFDSALGHHIDNLVVFADLVSTKPTTKAKAKAKR